MRINRIGICGLGFMVAMFAAGTEGVAQTAGAVGEMGWVPNHSATRSEEYAGQAACKTCHPAQSRNQAKSEMALSVMRPAESRVLKEHPSMSFVRGNYTYTLSDEGGKVSFTAGDGHDKITEQVLVAVGSGKVYQAYLIEHDGKFHRAPADYFASQGKLDADTDADAAMPATLENAWGKQLSAESLRGCLGCHSPAAVIEDKVDFASSNVGIGCEVCHGPGAAHVAAMRGGKKNDALIFNPAKMRPEMQSDFCDRCHESASKMKAEKSPHGVRSVISPAYRLEESQCWRVADQRSSCFFCHDSHAPKEEKTAAYDGKCLACHAKQGAVARADQPGKACPVGKTDCAGCHMPKVSVPNFPTLYTDHRIRIAVAGAPIPE